MKNFKNRLFSLVILFVAVLVGIAFAVDSDNDGMSDIYEEFFNLNSTNSVDAAYDYDSDSLTNLIESLLWTDPWESDTDADGFGDGTDNNPLSEITQTITATNLLEKAVELKSVKSTIKGVEAKVVGGIADPASGSRDRNHRPRLQQRSWTVQLFASEPLPVGKLNGQIQLNFSSGMMSVPVIGTVKPIILVVPEQVRFSARSSKVTERLIMFRSGDGRPLQILSTTLENGKGEVESKKLADDRWQLRLSVTSDSLSSTSSVQVETSCKSQPTITVPLSVR